MATEYEYWGQRFTEPDFEDEWDEVDYDAEFETPVAFEVIFQNGEWITDKSIDDWENADYLGDYGEEVSNPDYVYECLRDVVSDIIYQEYGDGISNGIYKITGYANFTIHIEGLGIGKLPWNEDELYTDSMETEMTHANVKDIDIERI